LLLNKGTKAALEEMAKKFSIPAEMLVFGLAYVASENALPEDFYQMGYSSLKKNFSHAAKNWANILKENQRSQKKKDDNGQRSS